MKKIVKLWNGFFKKMNIQLQLSLTFTIVAMVGMALLATLLYRQFVITSERSAEEHNQRLIEQVNSHMSYYLLNMRQLSDSIYFKSIKNCDFAQGNIDYDLSLMYYQNKESLVNIILVDESGQVLSGTPISKLKENADITSQQWFKDAFGSIENIHFSNPHVQNLVDDADNPYRWVVSLSRMVELVESGSVRRGVLLIDINYFSMEQLFQNVNYSDSGYVYLANSNGTIIYHPQQQLINSGLLEESNNQVVDYKDGSHMESLNGIKRIVTIKTVGYTGWKIIGIAPMQDFARQNMTIQVFGYLMFMVIILIAINRYLSLRIAKPIEELERSIMELEQGNLNVTVATSGPHEIEHLGTAVQKMVDQLKKLADDMVAEQELKRKNELDALQSQINPHFLYNTLDSIVWMLENSNTTDAIKMVLSLAKLFRISLSKGDNIILVSQELAHAKHYADIQSLRYKNNFHINFIVDPETENLYTIKLIIQPLLENAINHGMGYDDGDVTVRSYLKDDCLFIEVEDNGEGIEPDILKTLLTKEHTPKYSGSGIGLRNVDQRIRLSGGQQYGLAIESELGKGCLVRIKLPIIKDNPPGGDYSIE